MTAGPTENQPTENQPTDAQGLKQQLRHDLTAAMKARDTVTVSTLRMALTAITTAEVAGTESRTLSDDDVVGVLTREVKKRHEAAAMYADAGRDELAAQENAEAEVLGRYLPTQLTDDELASIVETEVAAQTDATGERPGPRQMGHVIKAVKERVGAAAEGSRVAAAVGAALQNQAN